MINWGIIATGKIAKKFASDFKSVKNGKLLAVASRDYKKAEEFAKLYNISKAYGSYEEILNDKEIDVVYIATPHSLHHDITIKALESGKNVLCEKPLSINYKLENNMFETAKKKKLFLMEALWTLFLPAINEVFKWISNNEIGNVVSINAEFGFKAPYEPKNRLFNPYLAGGALLDVGIYPILISQAIFGEYPLEIVFSGFIGKTKVDEVEGIILKYSKNRIAILSSSNVIQFKNSCLIYGEKGFIEIPLFWQAKKAYLKNLEGKTIKYFNDKRNTWGYNFEVEHVNKMFANNEKESSIATYEFSLNLIKIMDEIRRNIRLKYPIE